MDQIEIGLLTKEDLFGKKKLDVIKKYGTNAAITDFAIATGGMFQEEVIDSKTGILTGLKTYHIRDDKSLKGRTGFYFTKSIDEKRIVSCVDVKEKDNDALVVEQCGYACIRPVIESKLLFDYLKKKARPGYNGTYEVEFGEYPQWTVPLEMQKFLENAWNYYGFFKPNKIFKTLNDYYVTSISIFNDGMIYPVTSCHVVEYQGKKYAYVHLNLGSNQRISLDDKRVRLSSFDTTNDSYIWLEVSPVTWLLDFENKRLISKRCLLSGMGFVTENPVSTFEETEMYQFLKEFMLKDLFKNTDYLSLIEKLITEENIKTIKEMDKKDSKGIYKSKINDFEQKLSSNNLTKDELEELKNALEIEKRRKR